MKLIILQTGTSDQAEVYASKLDKITNIIGADKIQFVVISNESYLTVVDFEDRGTNDR